jgi:LPXTG-site transpeptidase (sortase) family protein
MVQPSPSATPSTPARVDVGMPVRIRIPSIGVDAPVDKIGLKAVMVNGKPRLDMVTPKFGRAGWFSPKPNRAKGETPAPRPGESGPAVIAAHVDSRSGPDVFARIKQMKRGDRIEVTDKDGTVHAFEMQRMKQTPKDQLPTDEIWGKTSGPALRLITCGGSFDKATGHYRDNVTIFADAAKASHG